ncbi:MAG: ABC transporter ATP-binding protein, partial [Phenylobacterium sp.]|nr:ABC transporter ATP-binding protein [Phenylobacterium sp.]
MTPLLAVRDLSIAFQGGAIEAVRGVSLDVNPGECLGIVGESGSGKSLTALAAMGLSPAGAVVSGSIRLDGQELLGLSDPDLNRLRGARMGMIFQDPLTSLAPHLRVGEQIAAPLLAHGGLSRGDAWREARRWLDRVRIPDPDARLRQFPHELSGGMRQRVMIAAALAAGPKLLLADEPTTALDVTVQAGILDLLQDLRAETGAAIVLISHDMGVMARMADRICVMRAGAYVEEGEAAQVLAAPRSDYAKALLAATPRLDGQGRPGRARPSPVAADAAPVLEAR